MNAEELQAEGRGKKQHIFLSGRGTFQGAPPVERTTQHEKKHLYTETSLTLKGRGL